MLVSILCQGQKLKYPQGQAVLEGGGRCVPLWQPLQGRQEYGLPPPLQGPGRAKELQGFLENTTKTCQDIWPVGHIWLMSQTFVQHVQRHGTIPAPVTTKKTCGINECNV